jgi:lipopolysaccharide/colanic/teichoic acid biosynthesis glycosyltransferase
MKSGIQIFNKNSINSNALSKVHQRYRIKRLLDLAITVPGLVLISPMLAMIAFWIKLDSPGPVFFRQVRIGRGGEYFRIYKFRTMFDNAEKMGEHLTVAGDFRITRSGRILRRLKLDELPQLLNVIKGEMSLVGPRPLVPEQVENYPLKFREKVLSVAPGITGLASLIYINESEILSRVHNPGQYYSHVILPQKIGYYIYYVSHFNFWLDLRIIITTLLVLLPIKVMKDYHLCRREFREAQHFAEILKREFQDDGSNA